MTDAEYDRIDDDGEGGVLDCPHVGGYNWDYGPIGPGTPRNRTSDDALLDAIADMSEERVAEGASELVPRTGWIELTSRTSPGDSTFVHSAGNWRYLIEVGGNPESGVWRHSSAIVCDTKP